jgi:hypothetical protein
VLVFEQRHFYAFIMRLTVEERVFILESYVVTMSYVHCRQSFFFEKFRRQASVKSASAKIIKKFRETGSLLDKNRNWQKSLLTPGILQDIQMAITKSPHKSLRKLSAQTGISLGSAHTAVRNMLKFYPYRMQIFRELIPGDYAKRVKYCRWFKNLIRGNIGVLDQVFFFTDEAWFHLSGYVNSQNCRTWRTEIPYNFTETPLHPQKIGVWCAISRRRIIGPLFFETGINAEDYKELIQQFIALLKVDERKCWFQQDSAAAYTAMVILQEFFGENVISKGL